MTKMSKKKNKKHQTGQPIILHIKHLNVGEKTFIYNYPPGFAFPCCCESDEDYDDEEQDGGESDEE